MLELKPEARRPAPASGRPSTLTESRTRPSIACFATQGSGSLDERRLLDLLAPLSPSPLPFDHSHKLISSLRLFRRLRDERPALVVMEGTGIGGGVAVLLANVFLGTRYVVSSGDAVGPFLGRSAGRFAGLLGGLYERLLCRRCAAFIGWTPYLVGRALTFGAPRAATAAGWSRQSEKREERGAVRRRLGIAEDAVVFGLAGSLDWNARVGYAYGAELVRAIRQVPRRDVVAVVVGDGSGRSRLEAEAGDDLGTRVILTGRVPPEDVAGYVGACDIASLPQSVDQVGSFRYSTKLSEYLAAGLPVVTGQIPAAYDLDGGWLWRLPGDAPWDRAYVAALARLMEHVSIADLEARRSSVPVSSPDFKSNLQRARVVALVEDLLTRTASARMEE
jgi:Glycosyl transferases group 1